MLVVKESDGDAIELACKFLRAGKIISFASDTVYGIAVDASNFKAVAALYEIKNRDPKKPIAIFVQNLAIAEKIFFFDEKSEKIAKNFLPGSLTLVLKTRKEAWSFLASNLNQNDDNFLGFRIVRNDFIEKLLKNFGGILAVTSANKSNQEAAVNATEVEKYFATSKLSLLVDGGSSKQKIPSTVAKIFDKKITILRQGLTDLSIA
jgi:L-threonylcarbamoyladenylate synthase